jgi:hypothetical protein
MHTSPLIRTIDGIETPSPGQWVIAPSQPVTASRRTRFHRHRHAAHTHGGTLTIGDRPEAIAFELYVDAMELPVPFSRPSLIVRSTAVETARDGRWIVSADVNGTDLQVVSLSLRYHGVFRRGGHAVAWLTLEAQLAALQGGRRGATGRRLDLTAELNAEAPRSLLRAARTSAGRS